MKTLKASEWEYPVNHKFTLSYKGKIVAEKETGFNRSEVLQYAFINGYTHVYWDFEKTFSNRNNKKEKI